MKKIIVPFLVLLSCQTVLFSQIDVDVKYLTSRELDTIHDFEKVTAVSLEACGDSLLPANLFRCVNLKHLNLSRNPQMNFDKVLGDLKRFTSLTYLNLNQNRLMNIPSSLFDLTNLNWLCLSDNGLTSIPKEITKLKNLEALDIGNFNSPHPMILVKRNHFDAIPPVVFKLTELKVLMCAYVGLHSISDEILELKKMELLILTDNSIPVPTIERLKARINQVIVN